MAGESRALPPPGGSCDARAWLAQLEARIARVGQRAPGLAPDGETKLLTLGVPVIDAELARAGVAAAALHEVRCAETLDAAAATGFALALAARAAAGAEGGATAGGLVWIAPRPAGREAGIAFGPGLAAFGIDPRGLLRVETGRDREALWAAGEAAATRGAGVCLLELRGNPVAADLAFSRRLALRARDHGVTVVLLRQAGGEEAGATATRWRIAAAPSRAGPRKWGGPPARAAARGEWRGGRPGEWTLEWNNDERLFALVEGGIRRADPGRRPPLSQHQPAEAADRPDPARPSRPGLAARRA